MNNIDQIIKKVVSGIGWLLLCSALGFYGYGIAAAIQQTLSGEFKDYPEFLSTTIGSVQALLLANLGFLLGISVANPGSRMATALRLSNPRAAAMTTSAAIDMKGQAQLFALIIYLLSLIACLITWITTGFSSDTHVVPLIPESAKMFVGVVLSYLTVVLINPQDPNA